MQKLLKNWIFTMVVCILLAMFAVMMFLAGVEIIPRLAAFVYSVLYILTAVALLLYVLLALFPLLVRYRGTLRWFVFGEAVLLLLTAAAYVAVNWDINIPLLSGLSVCSAFGLTLWLRGAVETVHAYLSADAPREPEEEKGEKARARKRIPLWRLVLYILLCAVGVWLLVKPPISDKFFVLAIAAVSAVLAVIFGLATYANRRATADERNAKKAAKAAPAAGEEQEAEPPAEGGAPALLPAAKRENDDE